MGRKPTIQKLKMISLNANDYNKTEEDTNELNKSTRNERQEFVENLFNNKIDGLTSCEEPVDLFRDLDKELASNEAVAVYDEIEVVKNSFERILSIYDDNKSNSVDLNERDEYIRKNFDLDIFLKLHTKTSEVKNALNESLFFDMDNENMLYFLTLIRDKVNELYIEFTKKAQSYCQLAFEILHNHRYVPTATKEVAWNLYKNYLKGLVPTFVDFVLELPGLSSFCQHDFTTIIDNNLLVLYGFLNANIYINNQIYLVIENTRIDRNAFEQFFGKLLCFSIFEYHETLNSLNLKNEESALLIPFILTSTDALLVDDVYLKELNLYYGRALLYECSLNNRDRDFMNRLTKVIEMNQTLKKGFSGANNSNFFI